MYSTFANAAPCDPTTTSAALNISVCAAKLTLSNVSMSILTLHAGPFAQNASNALLNAATSSSRLTMSRPPACGTVAIRCGSRSARSTRSSPPLQTGSLAAMELPDSDPWRNSGSDANADDVSVPGATAGPTNADRTRAIPPRNSSSSSSYKNTIDCPSSVNDCKSDRDHPPFPSLAFASSSTAGVKSAVADFAHASQPPDTKHRLFTS
mmetsp:Transcript_15731/g.34019  ORF Transcript_15731/g.34019 Transcript_15731/m.34019 type:complete len:209 (-) Transcript_15731:960-1586(-)